MKDCLFGSADLAKNIDPDNYPQTGYGIGLDLRSELPLLDGSLDKKSHYF